MGAGGGIPKAAPLPKAGGGIPKAGGGIPKAGGGIPKAIPEAGGGIPKAGWGIPKPETGCELVGRLPNMEGSVRHAGSGRSGFRARAPPRPPPPRARAAGEAGEAWGMEK